MTRPDYADAVEAALAPLDRWASQCHAASVELLRSGVLTDHEPRVARGTCSGVGGQHSWVVLGGDCYAQDAAVIDPTLWSYHPNVEGVWYGRNRTWHRPHGSGSIWAWGRPASAEDTGETPVGLTPRRPLSREALAFLDLLGPLGLEGWVQLAHAPVEGWPAAEIIDAICATRDPRTQTKTNATLAGYVPIDMIGMLTDRNPKGLYLPTTEMNQ
jgi:hypothetical protein